MANFLTRAQINELKADHRAERDLRYGDRIKTILLLNKGLSSSKVAEYLLLDEKTVNDYRRRYEEGGLEGLCVDSYEGGYSFLSTAELVELETELRSKIYPSVQSIIEYVLEEIGIEYSVSGMTKLLHRLGFSYKKPQPIPGKANAEAQEDFLSKLAELKETKSQENPILYVDGVHPQHNSHPDYGWFPKGENTQLKTNTGRQRVTLNGALDSETHDIIVQEDQILNAENTIGFFKRIESKYPESDCIYVILDNAGYYKGKVLQEYLDNSKIELIYLPPYAPNLNLIERVWKFFKKKVLANRYYESFLEFRQACLKFFKKRSWRSYQAELDTLLTDNFQIIGA